jgi:hypothetical protein
MLQGFILTEVNMEDNTYSIKEIKVTAMVYASRSSIVEHVRASGKLPDVIPLGGFPTACNVLVRKRGTDPILTEDEKLVYDAILRERRLPGGGALLVNERSKNLHREPAKEKRSGNGNFQKKKGKEDEG